MVKKNIFFCSIRHIEQIISFRNIALFYSSMWLWNEALDLSSFRVNRKENKWERSVVVMEVSELICKYLSREKQWYPRFVRATYIAFIIETYKNIYKDVYNSKSLSSRQGISSWIRSNLYEMGLRDFAKKFMISLQEAKFITNNISTMSENDCRDNIEKKLHFTE